MVSIIIPVFNAEKWLKRCIESCINQSYNNLEIILIDDGSSDSSPEICDEFKKSDDRITVIHKENNGVSSARNIGIDHAKGDYICFVDSDDWLERETISELLNEQHKKNYDFVVCNHTIYCGKKKKESRLLERKTIIGDKNVAEYVLKTVSFLRTPWGKLYKSSIIKKHGIRFDEELTLGEDTLFNYNYFRYTSSFSILAESYLYNYQEVYSTEKTKRYYQSAPFICNSRLKMFDGYCDIFKYKNYYDEYLNSISDNYIHSLSIIENLCVVSHSKKCEVISQNKIIKNNYLKLIKKASYKRMNLRDCYTLFCYRLGLFNILYVFYSLYHYIVKR